MMKFFEKNVLFINNNNIKGFSKGSNAYQQTYQLSRLTNLILAGEHLSDLDTELANHCKKIFLLKKTHKLSRIVASNCQIKELKNYIKINKVDLILSDFSEKSVKLAAKLAFKTNTEFHIVVWDHPFGDRYDQLTFLKWLELKIRLWFYERTINNASGFGFFINRGVFDCLGIKSHRNRSHFTVNGVPDQLLNINKSKSKTIVCIGRVRLDKGCDKIIEAFNLIAAENPSYELKFVGPVNERIPGEVANLVSKSPYREKISVTGRLPYDEAMSIVASAEIGIHLYESIDSLYWNHVLKIGEYHALQVAVICMDYPGTRDIATGNVDCKMIKNNSTDELYNAISELISNPILRQSFVKAGFDRVKGRRWQDVVNNFIKSIFE